ncbi:hypothetical protein SUGI_0554950 [Cryptomeria japonica]|nr:hypothetical protein SUGI_0554950 [Cryptomeria japonica]
MRAGLSTVQQTLTPEAANILNHAIAEACRRGHGQTTPLHVAATLLAAPASHLRQACIRSHPNSTHPLQCRALELCFSVALERLPAAQGLVPGSEPPISNALMAALKRAQAHQRRGCPEQQQQPLLAVKVELEQLIVSILDDPSVSRVMKEASFSSPAVKATIEQAISMASSHSSISLPSSAMDRVGFRLSSTPSILGNLGRNQHFEAINRNLDEVSSHPISQRNPYLSHRLQTTMGASDLSSNRNEEIRKVMEILLRVKKRNPILVGEKEPEAVMKELVHRIEKGETPEQLRGVQILETEISSFCSGNRDKDNIDMKFKELDRVVESHLNGGVILNVGDLRWLVEQPKAGGGAAIGVGVSSSVQQVVSKLGHLLARHGTSGRIWLIGIATCETYLRCQVYHPSVESDWEMQPVPMAARPAPGMFQRYVVSNSMDSLIPLKPFPAMVPPAKKSAESNELKKKIHCCSQCMANYEQELSKMEEEKKASVLSASPQSISEDQTSQTLPPWLKSAARTTSSVKGPDTLQAKDQELVWNKKLDEMQKKWSDTCRSLHPHFHVLRPVISVSQQESLRTPAQAMDANEKRQIDCTVENSGFQDPSRGNRMFSMPLDSLWHPSSQSQCAVPILAQTNGTVVEGISRASFTKGHARIPQVGLGGSSCDPSMSLPRSCHASTPQPTSVMTDLALGRSSLLLSPSCNISTIGERNPVELSHKERLNDLPGCRPSNFNLPWQLSPKVSTRLTDAHPPGATRSLFDQKSSKDFGSNQHVDADAFKKVYKGLDEKVGWQNEAVVSVTNAIMQCRSGNKRRGMGLKGDIWLLFMGPDRVAKWKMAAALPELIFGSERNFVCIKLSSHDSVMSSSWNQGPCEYAVNFRGKTALDRIAEAVRQNPFSVVLLEDVDQADSLIHGSLIQAIEKGRLSDSHGREVSVGNVIFIMTSSRTEKDQESARQDVRFSEEKVAMACGWPMQLSVDSARFEVLISKCLGLRGKRKADWMKNEPAQNDCGKNLKKISKEPLVCLDLNLSVEENDATDFSVSQGPAEACQGSRDSSDLTVEQGVKFASEHFKELADLVDERVVFKPYDFESLADKIVETISSKFFSIIGAEGLMEIDVKALEQILASVWFNPDGMKMFENWIEQVLECSLMEVRTSCNVSADTVIKLFIEKDCFSGGKPPAACLPRKISVNRRTKPCQNAGAI